MRYCDECRLVLLPPGDAVNYCGLTLHRWCADKAELEVDRMLEEDAYPTAEDASYDYWEGRYSA